MSRVPLLTLEDKFWKYVNKTDSCWIWIGYRNDAGYGVISQWVKRKRLKPVRAHRYSYELHIGPIPEGMVVCHECDNPPCVNPGHLFLGTKFDNTMDAWNKGRLPKPPSGIGASHPMAKLTEREVKFIRALAPYRKVGDNLLLAKRFGVHPETISKIICRATWTHI